MENSQRNAPPITLPWISCDHAMPEDYASVLVYLGNATQYLEPHKLAIASLTPKGEASECDFFEVGESPEDWLDEDGYDVGNPRDIWVTTAGDIYYEKPTVTHWCPLPKPPVDINSLPEAERVLL